MTQIVEQKLILGRNVVDSEICAKPDNTRYENTQCIFANTSTVNISSASGNLSAVLQTNLSHFYNSSKKGETPTEFVVELYKSQKVVSKNQGLQSFSTKGGSSFLL